MDTLKSVYPKASLLKPRNGGTTIMLEQLDCGHTASPHSDFTTGYGKDDKGKTYCYEDCAIRDLEEMRDTGKGAGYLSNGRVGNWPGSLSLPITYQKSSWHNFAGENGRRDAWFNIGKEQWHGVSIGDNDCCRFYRIGKITDPAAYDALISALKAQANLRTQALPVGERE